MTTYNFSPTVGDLVLNAFGMIQIRPTELTTTHFNDAALAFNLLMVDISNRNPHRWTLENVPITTAVGTPSYDLPARTLAVVIGTYTQGTRDRTLSAISAADYARQPNKTHSAPPTSYWFSLTNTPTITFWPVPDAISTVNLQTFRQVGDATLSNGNVLDTPYRFLDAATTGLAARLAENYRPEKEEKLNLRYEQRMIIAQKRDEETVNIRIEPNFSGYYR